MYLLLTKMFLSGGAEMADVMFTVYFDGNC